MEWLSNKAKQYGVTTLKVLILSFCFIYIFDRLGRYEANVVSAVTNSLASASQLFVGLVLLLTCVNWALEIWKWKLLASTLRAVSFAEAARQSLAALSAGLWTPNRIGEYGVKALYFKPKQRKRVMLLKLFGNGSQMFATLAFGIPGLLYLLVKYQIGLSAFKIVLLFCSLLLLLLLGYRYRKMNLLVSGLSLSNIIRYFKGLPKGVTYPTVVLSLARYVVFSSTFILLLTQLDPDLPLAEAAPFVTSVYLLSSVLPGFVIFDVAVKGSVAIWLATLVSIDPLSVAAAVCCMWILNFVLPAIFGTYFVITYKTYRR